jgi:hypothetical protein
VIPGGFKASWSYTPAGLQTAVESLLVTDFMLLLKHFIFWPYQLVSRLGICQKACGGRGSISIIHYFKRFMNLIKRFIKNFIPAGTGAAEAHY